MVEYDPASLVLWADPALVVINKPAGLLTLPDGYDRDAIHLKRVLEPALGKLWIVHRLDRETSGVLVLARTAAAHHALNDQFAGRQVQKIYHCLVTGSPEWNRQLVDQPLRKNGDRHHRTVVDRLHGKPASTEFTVLERYPGFSLVEARPHTGYTHQIRAHLAFCGNPIAGDNLYGGTEVLDPLQPGAAPLLDRVALHALQIRFIHPNLNEAVQFEAPYPDDFRSVVDYLRGLPTP